MRMRYRESLYNETENVHSQIIEVYVIVNFEWRMALILRDVSCQTIDGRKKKGI